MTIIPQLCQIFTKLLLIIVCQNSSSKPFCCSAFNSIICKLKRTPPYRKASVDSFCHTLFSWMEQVLSVVSVFQSNQLVKMTLCELLYIFMTLRFRELLPWAIRKHEFCGKFLPREYSCSMVKQENTFAIHNDISLYC